MNARKNDIISLLDEFIRVVQVEAGRQFQIYGLTFPQYQTLIALGRGKRLTMSKISEEILLSQPGATSIINNLVKKDIVKRCNDEKDRRKVVVRLTGKGIKLLKVLYAGREEFAKNISGSINSEDMEAFKRSLKIMLKMLAPVD